MQYWRLCLNLGPKSAEPLEVARDAPLPVHLHDAAELAVGCGVKVVFGWADRQEGAEGLVPIIRLRHLKLGVAEAPFKLGKEMADRLSIVPHVGTAALAATVLVVAALPSPESAVCLPEDGR